MSVHVRTYFSEAVLAEIPHLRAYAGSMTNDLSKADREVEETLKCALSIIDPMSPPANLRFRLLRVLRSFLIVSERMNRKDLIAQPAIDERLNRPFRVASGWDREAVILSAAVRLSHQEAAKMCGCKVDVYAERVTRGLTRLAELSPKEPVGTGASEASISQAFPVITVEDEFQRMLVASQS
jgi:RNA polymerase sigma-70 factor (ECF subfamily)